MSSSTAFEGRQSRRDAAAAANRDLDLLIRDLADARLDFGEDGVERIEEEITEETITTTTTTTKRRKKKRRAVSSSRAQEQQRKRDRAHEQLLQYASPPRRTHTPEVIMVEQPLKMEAAKEHATKIPISREQSKKKHHKSDSGFTFVTSIEKEFPARYEWRDCLVPTAGGIGSNERSDATDNLHSARRKQFERRDSNQSAVSSGSSTATASTATASTTNRNRRGGEDFATTATTQQQRKTKSGGGGGIVAPPSDFNDDRAVAVAVQRHRDGGLGGQPATVVRREFDEDGGVTKTVTTTTTEEREYKVINYDDGDDLDESAISADMAELDDLRQLAASAASAAASASKPKKQQRVVTFNDDLRLALDERNRRHVVRALNDTQKTRHGSGDSRSHGSGGGTVHVPVNSEVKPPGGGSSRAEDAAYRLRFLWRQPQSKGSPRHVCSACNSAIEGRCVTALFRKFHPEHFVCSYCLAQLSQGTFKERGQKPYCQNCYNRL